MLISDTRYVRYRGGHLDGTGGGPVLSSLRGVKLDVELHIKGDAEND